MGIAIRPYSATTDFPMLSRWWAAHSEPGPLETMVPSESTWVLELDGTPALSVSLILTNIPEYCLVDNLIGNPELKGSQRAEATFILLQYLEQYARDHGYRRLFCLAYRQKLKRLYESLGFGRTMDDVSTFVKSLTA